MGRLFVFLFLSVLCVSIVAKAAVAPEPIPVEKPTICLADKDQDGSISVRDYLSLLQTFMQEKDAQDLNLDGRIDNGDYTYHMLKVASNCEASKVADFCLRMPENYRPIKAFCGQYLTQVSQSIQE